MIQRRVILATLAVTVLIAGVAGCNDTKQPASSPVQTAQISFRASGQMFKLNCWEVWQDTDNDGVPDQDLFTLHCENVLDQSNGTPVTATPDIPWHYSLAITVIRAGQTQEQLVATSLIPGDSIEDFDSMTDYDTTRDLGGTKTHDGDLYYITPGGTPPNGGAAIITNANRIWLESNFIFLGEPNVLKQGTTYNVDLNQGDTVIVRARKQKISDSPGTGGAPWISNAPSQAVQLIGSLTIGGVSVPLQGTSTSPDSDAAGVTFSYTRR